MSDAKPRKLTEDEIQDILSVIPEIKSAADTVSKTNTKSMKVLIREQLKNIKLTPLGITDMKEEVIRQFGETVIRPGTVVGVSAATALGKQVTQAALNAFHTSGSSKNVSYGVDRITELINASKNPKHVSSTIYFQDQFLSFDDIIANKRPEITSISVNNLVVGTPEIVSADSINEPDWYNLFRQLVTDDFSSKEVLRLDIDPNLLYAYKLTMQDICAVIEASEAVVCVYSPISEGKIDIYPIEDQIVSKLTSMEIVSDENAALIFLSIVVIPKLDELIISGVAGIQQIYPVEAPVWQIVKQERRIEGKENEWFLILNLIKMRSTGITVDKLVKLCQVVGMEVLKERPTYIAVSCPISPTQFVTERIKEDEQAEREYEDRKKKEKARVIRRPPTELAKAAKLFYAESEGSNLKELFSHTDIDSTRTYCDNVHEIGDALGVEAQRSFLINEFIKVINFEGYINPRHIVLLVDFMTSLGSVYGATFNGVSRQDIGALDKASFEQAMSVFEEAAGFGEQKSVSGASSSVFIGKQALLGTGFSADYMKPENLDRYRETRKQLEEDDLTLDPTILSGLLQDFNLEKTEDTAMMETLENEMFGLGVDLGMGSGLDTGLGTDSVESPVPTSVISDVAMVSDEPLIKAKTIRSAELDEVGSSMSVAPCLRPTLGSPAPRPAARNILTELGTGKKKEFPKAKPAQIFDLSEFMK